MCLLDDYYQANRERFDIKIVYINEAHAADIWNIGESAGVINYSHQQITDRITCSQNLLQEFNSTLNIYCDNMNNDFETVFAAWPVRFFVVHNKQIKLINTVIDSQVDICAILACLESQ